MTMLRDREKDSYICGSLPSYPLSILVPGEFYFNYPTVELKKDASGRSSGFLCPLGDVFKSSVPMEQLWSHNLYTPKHISKVGLSVH